MISSVQMNSDQHPLLSQKLNLSKVKDPAVSLSCRFCWDHFRSIKLTHSRNLNLLSKEFCFNRKKKWVPYLWDLKALEHMTI